ncbi:TenA family protein [Desulfovibrio sp. OttesenSCG-928-A18]|nr:TenA family protein [Desulfovibrio sp. OttesenSCG-928-A18]
MKNNFSSMAFLTVQPIMQGICRHSFVVELVDGVLPADKFLYYLQQDRLYLAGYTRALAVTAGRMRSDDDLALVLHFADKTLTTGRELHDSYFREYQMPGTQARRSPGCLAYTNHLLERANMGSAAESIAALLTSFWMFRETGNHIRSLADVENPYSRWIEHFSCQEYSKLVDQAIELCDRLASETGDEERVRMAEAFLISSRYEYMLCEDAWNMSFWPS